MQKKKQIKIRKTNLIFKKSNQHKLQVAKNRSLYSELNSQFYADLYTIPPKSKSRPRNIKSQLFPIRKPSQIASMSTSHQAHHPGIPQSIIQSYIETSPSAYDTKKRTQRFTAISRKGARHVREKNFIKLEVRKKKQR